MRKSIFIIALLAAIPLLFFVRSYAWYELRDKDERISNEILTVSCFFGRQGDELFIDIVKCDGYGREVCINGQKVLEESIRVIPVSKTGDTLKFVKIIEGSLVYRCPNSNDDCWTDELKISLMYKFDSLQTTYDRQLLLTLFKKKDFDFSVH